MRSDGKLFVCGTNQEYQCSNAEEKNDDNYKDQENETESKMI